MVRTPNIFPLYPLPLSPNKADTEVTLGADNGHSVYSEYTLVDEDLCFQMPPNINREEAGTVPLAACIAHLGLFSRSCLDIDLKRSPDVSVLIWGGSCMFYNLNALLFKYEHY